MTDWIVPAFPVIVVLFLLALKMVEMASTYEYIEEKCPRLASWVAHRKWHNVLLLLTIFLLLGNIYQAATQEPLQIATSTVPSADPGVKNAEIQQLKHQLDEARRVRDLSGRKETPESAQAHFGRLLSEGLKLSECYTARDGVLVTATEQRKLGDWSRRTYTALASEVNPAVLSRFGEGYTISVTPGQEKWLKTACWATRLKAYDLKTIMAGVFAPPLTETERQQRAEGQKAIGIVLSEGQSLYGKYCGATPDSQRPADVETAISGAIANWETKALSTVTGWAGPEGMEIWDESSNAYADPQSIGQRCGNLDMRLRALRNVIRVCFGPARL